MSMASYDGLVVEIVRAIYTPEKKGTQDLFFVDFFHNTLFRGKLSSRMCPVRMGMVFSGRVLKLCTSPVDSVRCCSQIYIRMAATM